MENPFDQIFTELRSISHQLAAIQESTKATATINTSTYPPTGGIELAVLIAGLKKSTIYKLVMNDKIPFSKPAGKLVFVTADLLGWIKNKSNKEEY